MTELKDIITREDLEAYATESDITSLKDTFEIRCPNCLEYIIWDKWYSSWVNLDVKEFGEAAKHIRIECPLCSYIYDHRDTKLTPIDIKEEIKPRGFLDG